MKSKIGFFIFLTLCLFAATARAQTGSFTYQGRLTDGASAANGTYDFQFSLFNAGGAQIGATVAVSNVIVTNGVFTVQLDFGGAAFPGDERFLEIAVKKPLEASYTVLSPRQPVTSAPYSIKSLNAETAVNSLNLGGVAASGYVQTTDARLADDRNPTAGSGFYIQNTTSPQSTSNFNISGTGTANILNALLQYDINGSRVLAAPSGTQNTFTGIGAGGIATGNFNSFYGYLAGGQNTTGGGNAFFGTEAGKSTVGGIANTFFGRSAGIANIDGNLNTFLGVSSGAGNTSGNGNTFLGGTTGLANTVGNQNTLVGSQANVGANNLSFATAVGAGAIVNSSNTLVLGRAADTVQVPGNLTVSGTQTADIYNAVTQYNLGGVRFLSNPGSFNTFVGIDAGSNTTGFTNSFFGTGAGRDNTTGFRNSFFGSESGNLNTTGFANAFFGDSSGLKNTTGRSNSFFGSAAGQQNSTGNENSFFGRDAGRLNTVGNNNSFFGNNAGSANTTGVGNTFIGNNTGDNNNTGSNNTYIGLGAGSSNASGENNSALGINAGINNFTGSSNTFLGANSGGAGFLNFGTAIGAGATVTTSNTIVLGRGDGADKVRIPGLGAAGATPLCRNANNEISTCSGSFGNDELKQQIERQQKQIDEQKILIEELRAIVCAQNPAAALCQPKEEK